MQRKEEYEIMMLRIVHLPGFLAKITKFLCIKAITHHTAIHTKNTCQSFVASHEMLSV